LGAITSAEVDSKPHMLQNRAQRPNLNLNSNAIFQRADGRRQKKIVLKERDRLVLNVLQDPVYGCYSRVEGELGVLCLPSV
jgi:hypothetical protein